MLISEYYREYTKSTNYSNLLIVLLYIQRQLNLFKKELPLVYTDQKKFWLGYALEGLGEGVTLYNYAVGLKK